MKSKWAEARLYGIVDLGYVSVGALKQTARALCEGGVDVLQLRAKKHSASDILSMAREIRPLCAEFGIPFIVNDYPEIAHAVGADGVHIGQDDGSLAAVRKIVGGQMVVGRSTHSLAQARAAWDEGFDYLGFGPLFPTPTKAGRPGIGLSTVAVMQQEIGPHLPVFCIGGITFQTIDEVLAAGARRVVMVSALLQSADVREATARAKERVVSSVG
jgi:thiamine-phosphate pyrophosphorylase